MSSGDSDFSDSNSLVIDSDAGRVQRTIQFGDPSVPYFTPELDMQSLTSHATGQERHKFLFLNTRLSDVTLIVDGHNIPVHSILLSAASEAFASMFSSDWKKDGSAIPVPDCVLSAFQSLLRFVYTDEIVMLKQDIGSVLRVADRFLVQSLIDAITKPALDPAVVLPAAEFAIEHHNDNNNENNDSDLMFRCFSLIDANPLKYMRRPEFLTVPHKVIREMAARDSCAVREIRLFKRCIEWSVAECERRGLSATSENQRLVMQPFLHLIRFPLMTGQEFTGSPVRSGVLTETEMRQVCCSTQLCCPYSVLNNYNLTHCIIQVMQFLVTREAGDDMPFSCVPRADNSLMSRADRTKTCPNIVSKDKKRGVGMHDVIRRSKRRLHVYECESCDLSVCAVCAEDCHLSVHHSVRYRGKRDSWCSCLVHNCSKVKYNAFCVMPDVQSLENNAPDPTSSSSGDSCSEL